MRPTRDEMLMEIAQVVAKRSSCSRAHVGVVIALDGRILSTGYNGAPSGMDHCDHHCDCYLDEPARHELVRVEDSHRPECHSLKPCTISVHAEANAIAWAARWGIALQGAELFTTMCPCLACAQIIINSGITRVVSGAVYRSDAGLRLLQSAGIALY